MEFPCKWEVPRRTPNTNIVKSQQNNLKLGKHGTSSTHCRMHKSMNKTKALWIFHVSKLKHTFCSLFFTWILLHLSLYDRDTSSRLVKWNLIPPVLSLNMFKQCCTVLVVSLFHPVSIHFECAAINEFTEVLDTIWIQFNSLNGYRRRIVVEKLKSVEKSHTNNTSLKKIKLNMRLLLITY